METVWKLVTSFASIAMGAKWIERHVTLDRGTWGSEHKSSIEPTSERYS